MHIQDSHRQAALVSEDGGRTSTADTAGTAGVTASTAAAVGTDTSTRAGTPAAAAAAAGTRTDTGTGTETAGIGGAAGSGGPGRSAPLRVDAQRNLEHVLRAAREVFGELGYGAPMEDVARRARVGVGTVYRRFPSKDVLVRRIAEEETSRLTDQARTALGQEDEPWSALSRFLRTSVASGAGRLLPPQVLRVGAEAEDEAAGRGAQDEARVPQQRQAGRPELRVVGQRPSVEELDDPGAVELLDVVGQLVERARAAGELRGDVTVADVLLVIATAAPALPDPAHQAAASARLLDILLEGLRSRPV
ncbi:MULTISPECIES: helix-turn-helix domain-containing protein [unclassified Streptomyces]|uniref:TetR/AcrR family transcriptional regulator n=1 Tax=unclassified Streptomyces TaxID=2593676 RepID=UPI0034248FDB